MSRPLVADTGNLGAADIALLEIIEDKMGFEMPEIVELTRPVAQEAQEALAWTSPGANAKRTGASDS